MWQNPTVTNSRTIAKSYYLTLGILIAELGTFAKLCPALAWCFLFSNNMNRTRKQAANKRTNAHTDRPNKIETERRKKFIRIHHKSQSICSFRVYSMLATQNNINPTWRYKFPPYHCTFLWFLWTLLCASHYFSIFFSKYFFILLIT